MPEGIPLRHRTRRNRHLLAMSPDPRCGGLPIPDPSHGQCGNASKGRHKMQTSPKLIAAAFAGFLALGAPAVAQSAEDLTDKQVRAFVSTAMAVAEIQEHYKQDLAGVSDDAQREEIMQEANEAIMARVAETPGMSVEQYVQIAEAAQTDAELSARLVEELERQQAE
ncbi:hypothetical protein DDZ14_18880 [Maritimibacter sp. 55A14]|nr:hypothetical protein DDZ14_18880 [Maritimibacter sp. 55A14]